MNRIYLWSIASLVFMLAACVGVPSAQRVQDADQLARQHGWNSVRIEADPFVLVAYAPQEVRSTETLSIYIEGDGLAWISSSQPSLNPTPIHAVGLQLALQQPSGTAVYLARPCMYVEGQESRHCAMTYWTDKRFSEEVIASSNTAVSQLKAMFGAKKIELVGYSGGGAVVALVAARRDDVARLVTVAGNLEPVVWANAHHASPLRGSLNPADAWEQLQYVPQFHFVGGKDQNITQTVTEAYLARFPDEHKPLVRRVPEFEHGCCWTQQWADLYHQIH
jgi:dienelactone hydrolase